MELGFSTMPNKKKKIKKGTFMNQTPDKTSLELCDE